MGAHTGAARLTRYRRHAGRVLYAERLRQLGRRHLPRAVRKLGRRVRDFAAPEFEHVPEGWSRARSDPLVLDFEANGCAVAVEHEYEWASFLAAVSSREALAINHELPAALKAPGDHGAHNRVMSFAYVLGRVAQGREHVSLLDWRSGAGHYYVLARVLFPALGLDYVSKDAPASCALGRRLVPEAAFCEDDSCLDREYDVVLASSSLSLSEDWQTLLRRLSLSTRTLLSVARLPTVSQSASTVFLQRAYARGSASASASLEWALNRDEFVDSAGAAGVRLVREFSNSEELSIGGVSEQIARRGFLFRPADGGSA